MSHSMSSFNFAGVIAELQGDLTPETWGEPITVGNVTPVKLLDANSNRKHLVIQMLSAEVLALGFDNTTSWTKNFKQIMFNGVNMEGSTFEADDYRGPIWGIAGDADCQAIASEW